MVDRHSMSLCTWLVCNKNSQEHAYANQKALQHGQHRRALVTGQVYQTHGARRTTLDRSTMHMTKETTTLPDGRYLIYYSFDANVADPHVPAPAPAAPLSPPDRSVSYAEETARHV